MILGFFGFSSSLVTGRFVTVCNFLLIFSVFVNVISVAVDIKIESMSVNF